MLHDTDRWCPFRELGTSRKLALRNDGPFDYSRIRTHEGIFSALIFRGILFASPIMERFNRSCYFHDLQDWNTWRASVANISDKVICDPCPYGPSRHCVIENAVTFWESSELLHVYLGDDPGCRSFSDVIDWVTTHHLEDDQKAFPSFGNLNSYLLAIDLVYAGRLDAPTLEELALVVQKLNKGAANALRKMGLVSDKCSVAEVFKRFHTKMVDALSMHRDRMRYDIFTTEHGLCKYSKGKNV
ncbi:hypothetical protein K435DRAFT_651773 [Dendrothele bispora CBS 962.96]|uniref:Uncharacterized protein n=1 Tax=Dendrothele bispora (strain CBS 962.96) TaxID=1314807 RepID=A0A4S8MK55_DENBC|nr:hypothetical protein K435DRAFT_651773 [Dendrothele bispora CBS 962.96]